MAIVSSLNPLICGSLSPSGSHIQYGSRKPIFLVNSIQIAPMKAAKFIKYSINFSLQPQRSFQIQAVVDDDDYSFDSFEQEPREEGTATSVLAEGEQPEGEENVNTTTLVLSKELQPDEGEHKVTEITSLKKALFDALYGTDCGLRASSETRAEIVEILSQLEAKNPTPAPTKALTLLNGKWILACMSLTGLLPSMASRTPLSLNVAEISQIIDSEALTVRNSITFNGVFTTTSLSTNAKFEVRSPKRVQIKFVEGVIGTPQLTESIVLPEKFEFMGQKIDLSPFHGLISSIRDNTSSVIENISGHPPLKIPIAGDETQSWLLTTYLDEELRISRVDDGSIFVLVKEGSSLLATP